MEVLVLGGGLAGLALAPQLHNRYPDLAIRVLDGAPHDARWLIGAVWVRDARAAGFFQTDGQCASSSLLESTQPMLPSSSETFHQTPTLSPVGYSIMPGLRLRTTDECRFASE